jgi:hypothetical protein
LYFGITALVGMGLTIGGVASDNNTLTAIGLSMVVVPALISGGIGLACFGAWGTMTIGGGTMLAGIGTGLFAYAEYQESAGKGNWIQDLTGWSDGFYNGALLSISALATAGTFASLAGIGKYHIAGKNWDSGWCAMRRHYYEHEMYMGYRNVYGYTNGATAILNNGGVYASKVHTYTQWIICNKYFFVGMGRSSNLITTYFIKTITYKKYL